MKKAIRTIVITIILLSLVILMVRVFDIRVIKVSGHSMYPTLIENNYVLSTKENKLQKGDLILFEYENIKMIKRIIGIPGDKIEIKDNGDVYVNDSYLEETYKHEHVDEFKNEVTYPITVKEGEYFILGDNRDDSLDSRILSVGNIKREDIIGKVWLRIYPPKIIK